MAGGSFATAARRLRRHVAGRGEWWWAPLLYGVAVAWIYRDLWHQHGTPTALGWDVTWAYGPDLQFESDSVAAGELPAWNPYDRGGYAVAADPQFARYYPGRWPFVGLGAVLGSPWWVIQLEILAHHVIAGATMHLYLRSRGCSRAGAVIGGVTLVASVPVLVHKASLVLVPMAWIPLAWLAIDRLTEAPTWRRGLGVAGVIALVVTAGSPPGVFYAVLLVAPYAGWRAVQAAVVHRAALAAYAVRLAVPLALATIASAVIAAIVIVPFQELVTVASRADQHGPGFALGGSLPAVPTWAGMLAPSHGQVHAYVGLVALGLAIAGIALAWRRDGGIAILWVVTAVLAIMMTSGTGTPILPWLVDHIPGFDRLRAPPRYKLVAAWALAPVAAMGWVALTARVGRVRLVRAVAVGIAVALIGVPWIVIATRAPLTVPPVGRSAEATLAFSALATAVVVTAAWLPVRWLAALAVAVPVVIACDAPFFAFTPGAPPPAERRPAPEREPRVIAQLGDVERSWRVFDEFVLGDRVGVRRRIREFRGYPGGDPLSERRYNDVLARARSSPRILEAYNVRWILSGPSPRNGQPPSVVTQPGADGHYVASGPRRWEARHPAPVVAWYGAIQVVPTEKALDAVLAAETDDGARKVAVLEPADAARLGSARGPLEVAAISPPPSRAGELVEYEPDRVVVRVDAPAAGVVVLDEVAYPGWMVEVDGVDATPVRANYLLRAVAVPAGQHTITWTFRPTHHRVLLAGYLLGLSAIFTAWPPWGRLVARIRRYARR